MKDGITIRVLGDYGPFSRMGKSIGYEITVGGASYLIDCGSPLFQQIGGHGLKETRGLIITHCHDDHKRWFTDLALFNMYAPDIPHKVFLLTTEEVHEELIRASGPALDRSLSGDSKSIVNIAYEEYVEYRIIGPRARYRIVSEDKGDGRTALSIRDSGSGAVIGPDRAKIVISPRTKRARMLFRDPRYGEWIEPESFYPFSSNVFYEDGKNVYGDPEGFTIEAIKSPVWHGVPGIGIKIKSGNDSLIFSSDTVHDEKLWKQLCSEKREQRLPVPRTEFEAAAVIYGEINDYIERTWSEERYREAIASFDDSVTVHDIAVRNSVVHTDYRKLMNTVLDKDRVILTHSPDTMTSEWVLSKAEKRFRLKGRTFYEIVGEELYPFNADIYHKEAGKYYVGYRSDEGAYTVYEKEGLLSLSRHERSELGAPLYRVDLYEDIGGRYFPKLEDDNSLYFERNDGRVELIEFSENESRGRIVEDLRGRLSQRMKVERGKVEG